MCGVPTRQWTDSVHQNLATCRGWHCSTTFILIKVLSGKRTDFICFEQRPNQTACMSLNPSCVIPCQQQLSAQLLCLPKGKTAQASTVYGKKWNS